MRKRRFVLKTVPALRGCAAPAGTTRASIEEI